MIQDTKGKSSRLSIAVISSVGQVIASKKVVTGENVCLNTMKPGSYFVEYTNADNNISGVLKLIIQ